MTHIRPQFFTFDRQPLLLIVIVGVSVLEFQSDLTTYLLQVIAVAKSSDLVLMVLDASKVSN